MQTQDLVTVKEIAQEVNYTPTGVYNVIYAGRMPAVRQGRRVYVKREDVDKWKATLDAFQPIEPFTK